VRAVDASVRSAIFAALGTALVLGAHGPPALAQQGGRAARDLDPAAVERLLRQTDALHDAAWSVIHALESAARDDLAAETLLTRVTERVATRLAQQGNRGAGNHPEFDLWAGLHFLREGPANRAVRHLGRAAETGPFGLDVATRRRATVAFAEAVVWNGEPLAALGLLRAAFEELADDASPPAIAMVAIPLAAAQRSGAMDEEAAATLADALRRVAASAESDAAADAVARLRRAEADGLVVDRRFDAAIHVLRDEIAVADRSSDRARQLRARVALVPVLELAGRQSDADAERATALNTIRAMETSDSVLSEESTIALLVASEEWALARPLIAPALRRLSAPAATGPERARVARLVAAVMRGEGRDAEAERWSALAERIAPSPRGAGGRSGRRP